MLCSTPIGQWGREVLDDEITEADLLLADKMSNYRIIKNIHPCKEKEIDI